MASEYDAIPQQDGDGKEEAQFVAKAVAVSVIPDIPEEARDLTWTDTYYADNKVEGVIAVFDIDYEKIRRAMWCRSMIVVPIFVFYGIFMIMLPRTPDQDDFNSSFGIFWFVYTVSITVMLVSQIKKMSKGVIGLHVAVTKEGIRKDMNRFPLGNMFRTTTIIPYNEIKAIKAQRAGCCCTNTGNVHIQSSEDDTWNGISGLTHNADAFVSLVNAMIARNAAVIIDDVESQVKK